MSLQGLVLRRGQIEKAFFEEEIGRFPVLTQSEATDGRLEQVIFENGPDRFLFQAGGLSSPARANRVKVSMASARSPLFSCSRPA